MRAIAFLLFAAVLHAAPVTEFIFKDAPFASCHASTIVQLSNGDLMASWFGGTAEGKPDVAIWSSRRTSSGWSAPAELVREPGIATYNPVLFHANDGILWLYYKFGPHPSSWTAARRSSNDDGKTWSPVEHLPAGLYGPIRAKPLVMENGSIVSGTSVESYLSWACWIERSTDNGKSWTRIGPFTVAPDSGRAFVSQIASKIPGLYDWSRTQGIIQPSVIQLRGSHLRFYARSTALTGTVCISDSNDGGKTWTQARPIDVPNPNSGIDAVSLPDGRVVLVYNNSSLSRSPLNLAVSNDGEHFRMFYTLESGAGEYSYPAMIVGRDGNLNITYTWRRKRIRYVRYPLSGIPAK
jgi:predicted neuraminidase